MTDPGAGAEPSILPQVLGAFSVGLGLTELLAPNFLAKRIGIKPSAMSSVTMRAFGLREIAAGLGIFYRPRASRPVWMRVAGDAVDLAAMTLALRGAKHRGMLGAAIGAVLGVTALDVYVAKKLAAAEPDSAHEPVIFSVTINKTPEDVYRAFRKFSDLPKFMTYLDSVEETGAKTSHWVAKLPAGGTIAWDAEITDDVPGERIAWRTVEASPFAHAGEVSFATRPGGTGTEVRVKMQLALPGMRPNGMLAKALTKPQIKGDLRRFKQVLETGEIIFSDASSHGKPHPAQPSDDGAAFAREHAEKSEIGAMLPKRATSSNAASPKAVAAAHGDVLPPPPDAPKVPNGHPKVGGSL